MAPEILKFDHFALAVEDIEKALEVFRGFPGFSMGRPRAMGYDGRFYFANFHLGPQKVELLEDGGAGGFVGKFLAQRGEGVHHLTFFVRDLDGIVGALEKRGIRIVDRATTPDGWRTAFISPRSAFGALLQFWEPPADWFERHAEAAPSARRPKKRPPRGGRARRRR